MPLFEGLAYAGDKNVVVLDIGKAYTKCGVAGEMCPRCIIPSELKKDKNRQVKKLWEYQSEEELFENLKEFLFILYFRYLLINPKDRRIVVCESLMCPALFRETLARVLFQHFEVVSVLFSPGHLTTVLTLGITTGLVMDVGYSETLVVPVYEGIPILKAVQSLPVAGKAIHRNIFKLVAENGKVRSGDVEKPFSEVSEEILEDIKVRCCFVTRWDRAKKVHDVTMFGADASILPPAPSDVEYPLNGNSILHIGGKVREHACEVLFEQDNEQQSITTLLLDAILQCPIDMRLELSQNIIIIGGTAMLPGFYHRIQMELQWLLTLPRYANVLALKKFHFHHTPSKPNYTAWLGGAMFGALETLPSKSISKECYAESGTLTDWCDLTS